jgi:hypothetical protein
MGTAQGAPGNRALPHGRARWASRSMRSLRSSGHLLQLLPKPSLSEVPDQRTGEVAVARRRELLPVCYFHLVFSVPHALVPLIWQNKKLLFGLLFDASAATLLQVAADPARLGAEIGFLSILHTWGQTLQRHPHIHCVVPGGGLSLDRSRWIRSPPRFFLPVRVLSRVFRGKFVAGLRQAFHRKQIVFHGDWQPLANEKAFAAFLRTLFREEWVVYSKAPFGGPEHVLQYLARYTHRVAISNHRLLSVDDDRVTFRWKDYAHHNKSRAMTLALEEFLRRFLQHALPKGLPRIRYFGWLANRRRRELLPLCRTLLAVATPPAVTKDSESAVWRCPACGSAMQVAELLTAKQILRQQSHRVTLTARSGALHLAATPRAAACPRYVYLTAEKSLGRRSTA